MIGMLVWSLTTRSNWNIGTNGLGGGGERKMRENACSMMIINLVHYYHRELDKEKERE
jgi:hypothetical protein